MLLPFAWSHLKQDWPALRARLPLMVALSATGFAFNNAISYWALQYTEALNALLIQSSGPLFVALWSLLLFGMRLTVAQFAGITISLAGVLTILLRGDLTALVRHPVQPGRRDVRRRGAELWPLFGADDEAAEDTSTVADFLYHRLRRSSVAAVLGLGIFRRHHPEARSMTAATLSYVVIFPSTLAYLFFNRGIALIGPNRAAPFLHLVPVFGSAMAILLLGEQPRLFHLQATCWCWPAWSSPSRQASAAV